MKIARICGVLTLVTVLATVTNTISGCSSTDIQQPDVVVASWQNPDQPVTRYDEILVIFYENDQEVRAEGERGASAQMQQLGAKAFASVDSEPDIEKLEDPARVVSLLNEVGADALMTVEFVEYKAGYRTASDGFSAAWLVAAAIDDDLRRTVWAASVADRLASRLASLEVSIWDAGSEKKVWAATTDIQTYGNNQGDSRKFADVVVKELKELGYL